jgi:hypothetical protein
MEQLWKRGRNRSQRLAPPEAKERLRRPDLPLLQRDRIYAPHTIQRAISGTLAPLAHRRGYRATYPQLSRTVARAQGVGVGVRSQPGCTEPAVAPVKLSPSRRLPRDRATSSSGLCWPSHLSQVSTVGTSGIPELNVPSRLTWSRLTHRTTHGQACAQTSASLSALTLTESHALQDEGV